MVRVIALIIIMSTAVLGLVLFINSNKPAPTEETLSEANRVTDAFQPPTITHSATETPAPTPDTSILSSTDSSRMVIKTNKGSITISLFNKESPKMVENFYVKAVSGFYSNKIFHRVENWVIQGGDPKGNGTGGGKIPSEFNDKPFVEGSLGMARGGDREFTNDSQFFITKSEASWLNGDYANFGVVTEGMDVVKKIQIGDKILGIEMEE